MTLHAHAPARQASLEPGAPSHSGPALSAAEVMGSAPDVDKQQHEIDLAITPDREYSNDDAHSDEHHKQPPLVRPRSRFGAIAEYTGSHEHRAAFVRKVYTLLSLQMLFTLLTTCVCMYSSGLRASMAGSPRAWIWTTFAFVVVALLALYFCRDRHPLNYYLFFAFTVAMSLQVGVIGAICANAGLAMVRQCLKSDPYALNCTDVLK